MKQFQESQPEKDLSILMQAEMLKRHPDWIEEHAEEFRNYIEEHPDLLSTFYENPDTAIDELEKVFYH